MSEEVEFDAIVRRQKGYELLGKIHSKKLAPFIGKKVVVKVGKAGLVKD